MFTLNWTLARSPSGKTVMTYLGVGNALPSHADLARQHADTSRRQIPESWESIEVYVLERAPWTGSPWQLIGKQLARPDMDRVPVKIFDRGLLNPWLPYWYRLTLLRDGKVVYTTEPAPGEAVGGSQQGSRADSALAPMGYAGSLLDDPADIEIRSTAAASARGQAARRVQTPPPEPARRMEIDGVRQETLEPVSPMPRAASASRPVERTETVETVREQGSPREAATAAAEPASERQTRRGRREALGEPPTAKQFGARRLTRPGPGEEAESRPVLQQTIPSLTRADAPASATGPADGGDPLVDQDDGPAPRALAKGANAALQPGHVAVRIMTAGAPVDVSAVLLNSNGKVRGDHDLVFYNRPRYDGVHADGDTITADLDQIPADVHTIAVVVSIDLQAEPTATFDRRTAWQADISQPDTALRFQPDPFTSGETVTVAAEIYRRASDWKIRAVGQGYDTGLAGLATDYGVNVQG